MTGERDDLQRLEAALAGMPSAAFEARLRARLAERVRALREEMGMDMEVDMDTGLIARPGARPGFTAVTPYAIVEDVEALIAFAKQVFGAEEIERSQGGAGGIHCELKIGDSMLMVGGGIPAGTRGQHPVRPAALHVYVSDADAVYQRALAAGAESLGAPSDEPYGERAGYVKDAAGNEWYIATHTGPPYSSEGLATLTPGLRGPDAAAFIAFLERGLGARVEQRHDDPPGVVRHAVVRIEDAAIELSEAHGPWGGMQSGVYLYVPDCDALFASAVRAGATPIHQPADMPYGDRMGTIRDVWGNEWYIASHLQTRP